MAGRLEGKVAVVVGAAGGIGGATAGRFVREGAAVALVDLPGAELTNFAQDLIDMGGHADAIVVAPADIASEHSVRDCFDQIAASFPVLDILVNTAAIRIALGDVTQVPLDQWRRILDVNVLGAVLCSRYAIPMMTGGAASIVHVASVAAHRARAGWAPYDATKAALLALTRDMACDHVSQGIRVNSVSPGPTLTKYHIATYAAQNDVSPQLAAEHLTRRGASSLMDRPATPDEVANAILFLASDESSYMTGADIRVDGGPGQRTSGFADPAGSGGARAAPGRPRDPARSVDGQPGFTKVRGGTSCE